MDQILRFKQLKLDNYQWTGEITKEHRYCCQLSLLFRRHKPDFYTQTPVFPEFAQNLKIHRILFLTIFLKMTLSYHQYKFKTLHQPAFTEILRPLSGEAQGQWRGLSTPGTKLFLPMEWAKLSFFLLWSGQYFPFSFFGVCNNRKMGRKGETSSVSAPRNISSSYNTADSFLSS